MSEDFWAELVASYEGLELYNSTQKPEDQLTQIQYARMSIANYFNAQVTKARGRAANKTVVPSNETLTIE